MVEIKYCKFLLKNSIVSVLFQEKNVLKMNGFHTNLKKSRSIKISLHCRKNFE